MKWSMCKQKITKWHQLMLFSTPHNTEQLNAQPTLPASWVVIYSCMAVYLSRRTFSHTLSLCAFYQSVSAVLICLCCECYYHTFSFSVLWHLFKEQIWRRCQGSIARQGSTDWQPLHTSYVLIDMGVSSMSRNMQLQFLPTKEGNATNRNNDTSCQGMWL